MAKTTNKFVIDINKYLDFINGETAAPTQTPASDTATDWAGKYKDADDERAADINSAVTARENDETKAAADYDATVGRLNDSYDRAANLLKSKYLGQLKRLETAKSQSEQTANINYQKLLKYLPERLRAQGLSGLGTSQGAYIRATNDLNNRFVDIMGKYTEGKTAADNEYSTGLTSIEDTRDQGIQAAEDRKAGELQSIADRYLTAETAANSRYDTKVAMLDNYKFTEDENEKIRLDNEKSRQKQEAENLLNPLNAYFKTSSDLDTWYKANADKYGNDTYIKQLYDTYRSDLAEAEEEDAISNKLIINTSPRVSFKANDMGNWGAADTFHVNYIDDDGIGHDQSLTSTGLVNGQTVAAMKADDIAPNTLFILDGKMYFKNADGNILGLDKTSYPDDYQRIYKVVAGSKK